LGGVAIAPSAAPGRDSLVAWAAREAGGGQIFVTQVDAQGKKRRQRMLTRGDHESRWVAAAAIADGWLVAWSRERSSKAELMVARVDAELVRRGPERSLTEGGGSVGEIAMLGIGDRVLIAYEDRRGDAQVGSLYGRWVSASDGAPLGEVLRLSPSARHARSPILARRGEGALLAWIEQVTHAASGDSAEARRAVPRSALRFQVSSPAGELIGDPQSMTMPEGEEILAATVECDERICRAVVSVVEGSGAALYGARFVPGEAITPRRLARLGGGLRETVAPVLLDAHLFHVDGAADGARLVRWAEVTWH